jgi:hypothetical protein
MRQGSSPRRARHSVALFQGPLGQPCQFTLQVRLRGELGPACEVDCTGLEDALRFGQSEFCFFTERNPWIGLDWLQRKIWILLDPGTESPR